MDANQTRYHLLLGYEDWARCRAWSLAGNAPGALLSDEWAAASPEPSQRRLHWNSDRNELSLRPTLRLFVTPRGDDPPSVGSRRGAAADRFGNVYWIDDLETGIRVRSAGCREESAFWSSQNCPAAATPPSSGSSSAFTAVASPRPAPCRLRGLAVTQNHHLVVGVLNPAGVLVFDLQAGGPPVHLLWPGNVAFTPFDVAARPSGGVWILDRDQRRYWALDRHFQVIRSDSERPAPSATAVTPFRPADAPGSAAALPSSGFPAGASGPFATAIAATDASPLADVLDPIGIDAFPDGTVLILDATGPDAPGDSRLVRYRGSEPIASPISIGILRRITESADTEDRPLSAHDLALTTAEPSDANGSASGGTNVSTLYVASAAGNQAFAFRVSTTATSWTVEPGTEYLPMRRFTGRGLVVVGERPHYDAANRWVPLMAQDQARFDRSAMLVTQVFDGRNPDCVWHRLMLDACLPPETRVEIWSRASNDPADLEDNRLDWVAEPLPYRRGDGSELPFVSDPSGANPTAGTFELLFQNARGRHLQLRLRLSGNGRTSPHLRALRAYYPRHSYLVNYLPAVYRENPDSASFLDRFLANPEGILTATEDRIAAVHALLDPRGAPPEALAWLGEWFAIAFDPLWEDSRRRLFIQHAMTFFQYRGTRRGLEMAIRLVFDETIDARLFTEFPSQCRCAQQYRLVERFRTRPPSPEPSDSPSVPDAAERTLWQDWLRDRYEDNIANLIGIHAAVASGFEDIPLPADLPAHPTAQQEWRAFLNRAGQSATLIARRRRWQAFLERRHIRLDRLNAAWNTRWDAFASIPVPAELPADPEQLRDWRDFDGIVQPTALAAHQFTVLLPVTRIERTDAGHRQRTLRLARRVLDLEKPAHTVAEVNYYWALFRVGEARLGLDSVPVADVRELLLTPLVLNDGFLASSYLEATWSGRKNQ